MSRIAYVNGRYVQFSDAVVHIEDRGYQFADGVYEVCEIRSGFLVDERRHLERLDRSLGALRIVAPLASRPLAFVLRETIKRNRVTDGLVYVQVTRGVARRDHGFPVPDVTPSVVVTARSLDPEKIDSVAATGIAVVTVPETRWARVDIKSIGLLPNVLARQAAKDNGAREAWFVDTDGTVTEGASSNAWIVSRDGILITHESSRRILTGITYKVLKKVVAAQGLQFAERAFTVGEALEAREAFITSATQTVMPVVRVDGKPIGTGQPGEVAKSLRRLFHQAAELTPI